MAYRYGIRHQKMMFPESIEDYVPQDAPVRAYDAFVEALDLGKIAMVWDPHQVGCPQYDPRVMLKLLVYGYSYGVRSSRKLERECHYNLSFIWLTGGLKPDHKTIAEFRRRHNSALKLLLRQCAQLCMQLGLIEGNTLFVDGTLMRGNASLKNSWTAKRCKQNLKKIEERIEDILSQCAQIDEQESDKPSLVHMHETLKDQQALKQKVQTVLEKIETEERTSFNTTDQDSVRIRGPQGACAGYNVQSVVDRKHGLIVQCEAVSANEDTQQFARQIDQAQETLDKKCDTACSDAGYCNYKELKKIADQGIDVIVPSRQQAQRSSAKAFAKSSFQYDKKQDVYVCPSGHVLRYQGTENNNKRVYSAGGSVCRSCDHFGVCTTARKNGRKVSRYVDEEFREQLARRYLEEDAQAVYRLRKQKVELPFGHFKRNLQAGFFLLRGVANVCAETALLGCSFNLRRMITLLGVEQLQKNLVS